MTEKLIEVKDLTITFLNGERSNIAVRGVSFNVFRGEVLGVVGDSGSGKTAISLALMNLLDKTRKVKVDGEILFSLPDGSSINIVSAGGKSMQTLRGNTISMAFQEPMKALNPLMTCGQQVVEVLVQQKKLSNVEARAQTLEIFKSVNLLNPYRIYDSYPHEISGGQRQRVLISMAICCHPTLLIADEPATALDSISHRAIIDLFSKIKKDSGMALLLVSHDLDIVSEMADRVLVMHNGEIVEQGRTADVFERPSHPHTKGLLAYRSVFQRKADGLSSPSAVFSAKSVDGVQIPTFLGEAAVSRSYGCTISENTGSRIFEAIFQVERLSVHYYERSKWCISTQIQQIALDEVSLKIHEAEIVGIVGASGAGKTTLAKAMMGLSKTTSGKVLFRADDISMMGRQQKLEFCKNVQMVFQDPYSSLNPAFTIEEALTEPMKLHHLYGGAEERRRRAIFLLETVGLDKSILQKYPEQFSGGQRQRIAIARALSSEPQVLICDECISSLDYSNQVQILKLLKELRQQLNLACLFISHDLNAVNFLCDRVVVLHDGKVVETGDVGEVFINPRSIHTREILDAINGQNRL